MMKLTAGQAMHVEYYRKFSRWNPATHRATIWSYAQRLRAMNAISVGQQGKKGSVKILVEPNGYIIPALGEIAPIPRSIRKIAVVRGIAQSIMDGNYDDIPVLYDILGEMAFPEQKCLQAIRELPEFPHNRHQRAIECLEIRKANYEPWSKTMDNADELVAMPPTEMMARMVEYGLSQYEAEVVTTTRQAPDQDPRGLISMMASQTRHHVKSAEASRDNILWAHYFPVYRLCLRLSR